jgi:N-terminal acetyltransferase B complex catalytic subunit
VYNLKIGKVEGDKDDDTKKNWHGHVTAVTVAPYFRKQGLAKALMNHLERVSANVHNAYFVDLFVRSSNAVAINMYKKLGYDVYQAVDRYAFVKYLDIIRLMAINLLRMPMI